MLIFDRQFVHDRCPETLRLESSIYLMRRSGKRNCLSVLSQETNQYESS